MQVFVENPNTIVIDVDQGRQGRGIENITYTEVSGQYFLIVSYTDGTTETLGPLVVTGGAAFLLGGTAGALPYQSAPNTTDFVALGTQNQVLVAGATTPQYTSSLTGLTVNNSAIGNTTPSTGAFTNLSASGTFALTGDVVQISEGGTGQSTANAAFNALAPSQTGNAGKYLKTDGTNTSWDQLDISTADITGVLPVANGGTGASTAAGARANLSAAVLGANNDITSMTGVTGGISSPDFVQFDTAATNTNAVGKVYWDASQGTLDLGLLGGNVVSRIGQSLVAYVTNAEAVTITKGQAVYLFGAQGDRATVKLAYNTSDATSAKTFGVVAENIPANGTGFVMCQGVLEGLNLGAFTAGDTLYLGATPGSLTATKPAAPNHLVYVGLVERANPGNGQLYVKVQNGYELDEIHDVQIINPQNGQTIIYDASTSLWKNANLTAGSGISVTNGAASITVSNTGVLSFSGGTTGLTPSTSTTGAVTLGGTLAISHGGTGQTTANDAFNALAPSQTGNAGKYLKTDGTNSSWDLLDISTSDITGTLPVANGGTGATTAAGALTNLNAASQSTTISAGTGLTGGGDLSTNRTISIANTTVTAGAYGSASDTLTATVNAQGQLTALAATPIAIANTQISGLGTMSTQNASSVSITGGTITGITDLAVADGGTGASDASTARSNLGAAASATTISAGTGLTGGGDLSANRTISIADTTVTAASYGSASSVGTFTVNAQGQLTAAASTPIAIANTQVSGLGTMSTQNSNSVTITGGSISGITDLAIADGGTGASDAPTARTNLGLGSAAVLNAGVALGVATLDAGGTVPLSQIPASIQGGVSYQGSWNAATNTPTIVSGVGSKGYYYVVSVAGSTTIDGISDWLPGDWIIYNGTVWQKIDNTDAVASVNGYTGVVVLSAADVGAPPTSRTITAGTGLTGGGDLSANRTISIDNTTVTSGSYGSASSVATFTVNGQGQLTAAASTPIAITNTQVSGLGTMSTQDSNSVSITGGSISGITDLAVADGGTGASDAATARTNLGAAASATTISAGTGLTGGGDLSANRTLSIADTTVTAASYGSASSVGTFTVNAQGQLTAAASTPIAITNTQVSGLGTMSTQNANAVAITGGSIDGVTIGGSTTGAGSFTTLTTSSTVTLNGGTANGVAYLNGSKVLTTGSALTFDGAGAFRVTESSGTAALQLLTSGSGGQLAYIQPTRSGPLDISSESSNPSIAFRLGTSAPTTEQMRLTSTGLITQRDATIYGITVGRGAGAVGTNVVVGASALASNTTGNRNTAVGYLALNPNTTGSENTAVGYGALDANSTGNENNAFGTDALGANTTGISNSAFGSAALRANTTASDNTGLGYATLLVNTTGAYNTAVGSRALFSNTTASNNTAVGFQSAYSNTTGTALVAVGRLALYSNSTGVANTAIGADYPGVATGPLYYNTTGGFNTAVGVGALSANTTASNNTAVGYQAGYSAQTLSNNAYFGYQAGYNTTSQQNVFVGAQAGFGVVANGGQTIVGYQAGYSNVGTGSTIIGYQAGYNSTGTQNTFVGPYNGTNSCAYSMTTGSKNTILGGYNGNQGGLDIRTASNYLVLSDGDGTLLAFTAKDNTFALQGGTISSGTGIAFPATQNASSNANTLDDYEEGSWTPVLGSSGTLTGQTYTRQEGRYTKVGRLVTCSFDVILSNRGTLTGEARILGLPFTCVSGNGFRSGFTCGEFSNLTANFVQFGGIVVDNTSQIYIRALTAAASSSAIPTATDAWSNSTQVIGTVTYMTA